MNIYEDCGYNKCDSSIELSTAFLKECSHFLGYLIDSTVIDEGPIGQGTAILSNHCPCL